MQRKQIEHKSEYKEGKSMNEELMRKMGMGDKVDLVKQGRCPDCGEKVDGSEFRDKKSREEYMISGLCQKCQDKVFKDDL